jgi:hypothetical protein
MLTQGFALGYDLSPLPHPKNRSLGTPVRGSELFGADILPNMSYQQLNLSKI